MRNKGFRREFESVVVFGVSSMRRLPIAPNLVPSHTAYVVLDDFGKLGRAYRETDENQADLDSLIDNFRTGQFSKPVRVIGFNVTEGWARDVSEDIAWEILRQTVIEGETLSGGTRDFVRLHLILMKTTDQYRWYAEHCEQQARVNPVVALPYNALARGWRDVAAVLAALEGE